MTAHNFKDRFNMTYEEAQEFVDQFKSGLPTLFKWVAGMEKLGEMQGYVTTMFGRPRRLKCYFDTGEWSWISFAKRSAVNSAIQGCIPKSARVLTDEGYQTIEKLLDKPMFKAWTGFSYKNATVIPKGVAPLYRVTTNKGRSVEVDNRHKFKVQTDTGYEWKSILDLTKGDKICINAVNSQSTKEDKLAFIAGCILGDGHIYEKERPGKSIYRNTQLTIGQKKLDDLYPLYRDYIKDLYNYDVKLKPKTHKTDKDVWSTRYSIDYYKVDLIEDLKELGMYPNDNAHTKTVPIKVLEGRGVYSFVRGYYYTDMKRKDGTCHTPNIKLLEQLALLINMLGFGVIITKDKEGNGILRIQDGTSFAKFMQTGIREYQSKCTTTIPPRNVIDEFKNSCSFKTDTERTVKARINHGGITSLNFILNRYTPKEYYYYEEVESVESLDKEEEMYTLSVDDDLHQYIVDGYISKNSGADILKIVLIRIFNKYYNNPQTGPLTKLISFKNTVHDEVNYQIYKDKEHNYNIFKKLVKETISLMRVQLEGWEFPMEVGLSIGNRWGQSVDFEFDPDTLEITSPKGDPITDKDIRKTLGLEKKVEEHKEDNFEDLSNLYIEY